MAARLISVDLDALDSIAERAEAGDPQSAKQLKSVATPQVVRHLIARVRKLEADRLDYLPPF